MNSAIISPTQFSNHFSVSHLRFRPPVFAIWIVYRIRISLFPISSRVESFYISFFPSSLFLLFPLFIPPSLVVRRVYAIWIFLIPFYSRILSSLFPFYSSPLFSFAFFFFSFSAFYFPCPLFPLPSFFMADTPEKRFIISSSVFL